MPKGADYDIDLTEIVESSASASNIARILLRKGVCVIKAGSPEHQIEAARSECEFLYKSKEFKTPEKDPRTADDYQDDEKVLWLTDEWVAEKKSGTDDFPALLHFNSIVGGFAAGLIEPIKEHLGLELTNRTAGMLSRYASDETKKPEFRMHVDNPYQMKSVPDDKRRVTCIYYFNPPNWSIEKDGGEVEAIMTDNRPWRTRKSDKDDSDSEDSNKGPTWGQRQCGSTTINPKGDTLVVYLAHETLHGVKPVKGRRKRFSLSMWLTA